MDRDLGEIGDHDPLSLKEAADILLRGLVKASTLRNAAMRGELEVERWGKRMITTRAAVNAWRERCRKPAIPSAELQRRSEAANQAARVARWSGYARQLTEREPNEATEALAALRATAEQAKREAKAKKREA